MIALYLLAAHLLGDFVLQDRWEATGKFGLKSAEAFNLRARHVVKYLLPFVPIVVWRSPGATDAGAFCALLFLLHFATDARRYRSTLGDTIQWYYDYRVNPEAVTQEWMQHTITQAELIGRPASTRIDPRRPTPNPWPPISLMIDQTLHICQLALVAGLFLS